MTFMSSVRPLQGELLHEDIACGSKMHYAPITMKEKEKPTKQFQRRVRIIQSHYASHFKIGQSSYKQC